MEVQSKTSVSEHVFQSLAEIALKDIDDIVSKEKKGPFAGLTRMFSDRFSPQVTVKRKENEEGFGEVGYELKLAVLYGVNIPEAAAKIRKKLIETVENITGYKVVQVDIIVDQVVLAKDLEEENEDESENEKQEPTPVIVPPGV